MVNRFAGGQGETAVMTGLAGALLDARMTENHLIPGNSPVANVAGLRCRDVLDRKLGGAEACRVPVASGAVARCAAEYSLQVTRLAAGLFVLAGEEETGRCMIEIERVLRRRGRLLGGGGDT